MGREIGRNNHWDTGFHIPSGAGRRVLSIADKAEPILVNCNPLRTTGTVTFKAADYMNSLLERDRAGAATEEAAAAL